LLLLTVASDSLDDVLCVPVHDNLLAKVAANLSWCGVTRTKVLRVSEVHDGVKGVTPLRTIQFTQFNVKHVWVHQVQLHWWAGSSNNGSSNGSSSGNSSSSMSLPRP
jgi:hypothetical protein